MKKRKGFKAVSPTNATEIEVGEVGPIPNPENIIEQAVNIIRKETEK